MNKFETALSFANLHTLHMSIIQTHGIKKKLKTFDDNCKRGHVRRFKHMINYYSLVSTCFAITDEIITFKIPYNYFHLFRYTKSITPEFPKLRIFCSTKKIIVTPKERVISSERSTSADKRIWWNETLTSTNTINNKPRGDCNICINREWEVFTRWIGKK